MTTIYAITDENGKIIEVAKNGAVADIICKSWNESAKMDKTGKVYKVEEGTFTKGAKG
jgi:hypothetical protein